MNADAAAPRRSQAQRRALTIERLTDAVIHCLVHLGYAGTTTAAVAQQAGLSQGAIFRHFDNRQALIIATMDVIAGQFIAHYREQVARLRDSTEDDTVIAITALHNVTRSDRQVAWFEVQQAARTDEALCAAFRPIFMRNQAENIALARELFPDTLAQLPFFEDLVQMMIQVFHGQTLDAHLVGTSGTDAGHLQTLQSMTRLALTVLGGTAGLTVPE